MLSINAATSPKPIQRPAPRIGFNVSVFTYLSTVSKISAAFLSSVLFRSEELTLKPVTLLFYEFLYALLSAIVLGL